MHFFLYFECTSHNKLRVPPRSYVRSMRYILSLHSQFLLKIRLCLLIELLSILSLVSKLPPRTWIITQLIDYSISFQQKMLVSLAYVHFLLYFECTSHNLWVPPRSYVRSMRYILQLVRKYFTKSVSTLSSAIQHLIFKRA